MTDYELTLKAFVKHMQTAQSEYKFYYDKVNEMDKATNDILHQIELGKPSERNKWATKLAKARKERRIAKDIVLMTEPIKKFAEENQVQIKAIERLLGEVRKNQKHLRERQYTPRVVKDLTICEKGVESK